MARISFRRTFRRLLHQVGTKVATFFFEVTSAGSRPQGEYTMLRYLSLLLLPAALLLVSPAQAFASWHSWRDPGWRGQRYDDLSGRYVSRESGKECEIYRRGRSYVFVNENGSRARFVFTGPRRLEQVSGEWDPSVTATVLRGRSGLTIRFDSPNAPSGFWDAAY
jgi:hypothetical protein